MGGDVDDWGGREGGREEEVRNLGEAKSKARGKTNHISGERKARRPREERDCCARSSP
jgi:hypothetical protein